MVTDASPKILQGPPYINIFQALNNIYIHSAINCLGPFIVWYPLLNVRESRAQFPIRSPGTLLRCALVAGCRPFASQNARKTRNMGFGPNYISGGHSRCLLVQPVPWKLRLEMVIRMHIYGAFQISLFLPQTHTHC